MYILNNLSQFLSNSSNYTKDVVVFFDGHYKNKYEYEESVMRSFFSLLMNKYTPEQIKNSIRQYNLEKVLNENF
jgi:hypothetical protein